MSGFTNATGQEVMLALTGQGSISGKPLDHYIALLLADPGDDLSNWMEGAFGAYARLLTRWTSDPAGDGRCSNDRELLWTPTSDSVGPFTHFGVCQSSDVGGGASSCWYVGDMTNPRSFSNGVPERFAIGSLILDMNAN